MSTTKFQCLNDSGNPIFKVDTLNGTAITGKLLINGADASTISGRTTIGSVATTGNTGVYTISNISIGQTMANTNYKIVGNLTSTTNNTNVYVVTFNNLTTTTFSANIMRLDNLYGAWTDTNLALSWVIIPS
jgi:hypothetical protein